jgi:hypothetical protein
LWETTGSADFSGNPVIKPSAGYVVHRPLEIALCQLRLGDVTFVQGFTKFIGGMFGERRCICSDVLTPRHFLFECSRFKAQRICFRDSVEECAKLIQDDNELMRELKKENENLTIRKRRIPKWGEINLISLLPGCVMNFVASCDIWLLRGGVVDV